MCGLEWKMEVRSVHVVVGVSVNRALVCRLHSWKSKDREIAWRTDSARGLSCCCQPEWRFICARCAFGVVCLVVTDRSGERKCSEAEAHSNQAQPGGGSAGESAQVELVALLVWRAGCDGSYHQYAPCSEWAEQMTLLVLSTLLCAACGSVRVSHLFLNGFDWGVGCFMCVSPRCCLVHLRSLCASTDRLGTHSRTGPGQVPR